MWRCVEPMNKMNDSQNPIFSHFFLENIYIDWMAIIFSNMSCRLAIHPLSQTHPHGQGHTHKLILSISLCRFDIFSANYYYSLFLYLNCVRLYGLCGAQVFMVDSRVQGTGWRGYKLKSCDKFNCAWDVGLDLSNAAYRHTQYSAVQCAWMVHS